VALIHRLDQRISKTLESYLLYKSREKQTFFGDGKEKEVLDIEEKEYD
jgi:hypothetical protein